MQVLPTLPPSPPPDLVWQPITRDALSALVELANACFVADGGLHFLFETESLCSLFFPDTPRATIGAFAPDGRLVACATEQRDDDVNRPRVVMVGHVHPDLRYLGLGGYLMRWSLAQAELLMDGSPGQKVLKVRTESLTESAHRLYLAHGFEPKMEELVMRRDLHLPLPDCQFPPGVTMTTWDMTLADQFFQAYHAAFRERPGFPGWTAAEWVNNFTDDDDNFRPDWSLLARADDTPLGFLMASANPPHGFVMQVGVVPSARRRGICSALIVETMQRMQAAGALSTQLLVNINNPGAIRAYEALGFATMGRRAYYERFLTVGMRIGQESL